MFDYPDLGKIDRLAILKTRKEAVEYWRMLKHLKELWIAFGEKAERLVAIYDWHSKQKQMINDLNAVIDWHDIKTTNISTEIDRVDAYLQDIARMLGESPMEDAIAEALADDDGPLG